MADGRSREAVDGTELFADGRINEYEYAALFGQAVLVHDEVRSIDHVADSAALRASVAAICCVRRVWADEDHTCFAPGDASDNARLAAKHVMWAIYCDSGRQRDSQYTAQAGQVKLVWDIFGNPFGPAALDPAWRTPTVTNLATAAYNERAMPSGELDPARLAVLADALEEAGCQDAEILGHLRSPGPHARGCWAVDLALGKE